MTTPGTTEYSTGKQNTSTSSEPLSSGGGCVRFTCEGSIEIWEEEENAGIAYCDGREAARIACPADERVDTSTGHTIGNIPCAALPPPRQIRAKDATTEQHAAEEIGI